MQGIDVSPITIVLGDKGGVGKSLIAELIAPKPSTTGHGDVRSISDRRWTYVPPGPRRRGTKQRRA